MWEIFPRTKFFFRAQNVLEAKFEKVHPNEYELNVKKGFKIGHKQVIFK
jgi:hypothetical protein